MLIFTPSYVILNLTNLGKDTLHKKNGNVLSAMGLL